MTRIKTTTWDG